MKSAADVLEAINGLERRFPVQQWRARDVDLWPAYRVRLFMNVTLAILSQAPGEPPARRLAHLAARGARALWRVPLAALRDAGKNAAPQRGTSAVFLSDGLSFTRLAGCWYDRVVDPVMLALQARGQTVLKLTPLPDVHVPRITPSRLIQPSIDRIKLLARLRRTEAVLPEFDTFLVEARRLFGHHAPGREWLVLQAKRLDALASWFARLMARTGATQAFVNNYYSLEGSAFVLASRRLGMRSADLQHGLQGEHHCAYGRWAKVPENGYSTLPDEFWVWSQDEADAIDAWRGNRQQHAPRVIGNLWRERWLAETDPLIGGYIAQARGMRAPATAQVLVNLSWGLAPEETEKIVQAAKLAGPGVAWWWRLHPVQAHRWAEFAAQLDRHGLDSTQVAMTTEMPLFALLRAADVAVAHSSTVIQEAASFGVPSVVTSDYGAEIHAQLIHSGMALKATDDRAIAAAVRRLTQHPRATMASASPTAPNFLAEWLDRPFGTPASAQAH